MKKILSIMCVVAFTLLVSSLALASDNISPDCDGLDGEAYELCNSYCADKLCQTDDPNGSAHSCEMLRRNFERQTGVDYFPCDTIACAICGDPDPNNLLNTIGVCEEIKAVECVEPAIPAGRVSCDEVTIPIPIAEGNTLGVGCDNIDPNNILGPMYPDCQNGMPGFVCTMFLGGTIIDECPSVPSCYE